MSAQLILYPQNHDGTYSSTSTPVLNQYVADGNLNSGFVTTTATGGSTPSHTVISSYIPISAWRSFYSTSGTFASTSAPTVTTGLNLTASGSGLSTSGVYQLISNLTIGACYEVKVTISTGNSAGVLYLGNLYNPTWVANSVTYANLGGTSFSWSGQAGTKTHQFTAGQTEEVLVLDYWASNGTTLVISNISITECPASAPQVYSDLSDGQVICDLYEEEAIPLSLSVDDFKNVAEKTQSYSKDFHLPNTKRNNKIFSHIFEVTRSTDAFSFNPYIKTRAILKEDSYTLFEGFLQLIDINDKEGEISYNVNLYSEPVTLKDILENKTFADINFTELQHDYTITNIKNSWDDSTGLDLAQNLTTSSVAYEAAIGLGNTNVLKYPFVNWRGDWSIDASGNIGLLDLEQVFRPFIQVRYLLKRIINEAGFEYHSTFFETTDFKKLFMDFNWGQGLGSSQVMESFTTDNHSQTKIYAGTTYTELEVGTAISENPTGIAGAYLSGNTITAINNNTTIQVTYISTFYNKDQSSARTVEARWERTGSNTSPIDYTGVITLGQATVAGVMDKYTWQGTFTITMQSTDTLKPVFKASVTNKVGQGNATTSTLGTYNTFWYGSEFTFQLTSVQIGASSLLHSIRGELNQWEFLKGIMTMFNLVTVKEDEVLRIEPYADIFINNSESTQHNWTDKVDISEINLKPLELKRKTKFTYEDDEDDYALGVYKKATSGYLYGTKELDGTTAMPNQVSILTGEEEIIATPFAPTIIKPATDLFPADLTIPNIYSGNDDGTEFEDFENLPRILYNLGVKSISVKTYFVPAQNGAAQINSEDEFLQFGHLTDIPTVAGTTQDYNFGQCQLFQPIGASPIDNLYQVYYSPYYDELYNPDTRVMTMKVNLTPADIQNFRFYDTVVIKNREYRVNKIEYKPNTLAKVEFILIP